MTTTVPKRRIWGWMAFDWASQPYYTLGLTFIFAPYFGVVAADYFLAAGGEVDAKAANARAKSMWDFGQTIAGIVIALTAPMLGALADTTGRKRPWIFFFSALYVLGAASLWFLEADSTSLILFLSLFYVGFIAAESVLNFVNAYLPSLGTEEQIGRISGAGASFGYWGGLLSLVIMLCFFAESGEGTKTIIGLDPIFGLDAENKEGTRAVGPFMAIWYALFILPFFLFVKDDKTVAQPIPSFRRVFGDLKLTLKTVWKRSSTRNFLLASMFYRDALNALYASGGIYAAFVLGWTVKELGPFGIVSVITAAVFTYVGGRFDARVGPKPVIITCVILLMIVASFIVGMSREQVFGVPLKVGSNIPDIIFFVCGSVIGGAGGALYAASRSLMARHASEDRPTEAFGLFALSGKATAFAAPLLVGIFTTLTGSVQLGYVPVIFLFLLGLFLLRWVNPEGDRGV